MVVGINHETAPVEIRERASISDVAFDDVLKTLRESRTVLESVAVSTCNRTELYCVVSSERAGADYLSSLLSQRTQETVVDIRPYLYIKSGYEAVHHLFRVVSGLNSMVVGETQILGQVRSAYLLACDQGNVGSLLNKVFRLAIEVGKKAQSETMIGQNPVSVSYAALQLAKKIVGNLDGKRMLIIGAGKMSTLTLAHAKSMGTSHISIANRTFSKANEIAVKNGVTAIQWNDMEQAIEQVDVVVVSTSANQYIVTESMLTAVQKKRGHRPLVVIDIAVPRNVQPSVNNIRQIYHFDIDDLNGVIEANLEERRRATDEVEQLIASAIANFAEWLSEQAVVPIISAIRKKGEDIEQSVMDSLKRKLPHLSEKDFSLIHKHAMSIVNQLLRDPVLYMKEQSVLSRTERQVESYARLFGVQDHLSHDAVTHLLDGFKAGEAAEHLTLGAALKAWKASWFIDESHRPDGLQSEGLPVSSTSR